MKKSVVIIISFIILTETCLTSFASSLSSLYKTDSSTGWALQTNTPHMGQKTSSYKFYNNSFYQTYDTEMRSAVAVWGSYINLTYSSLSTHGNVIPYTPTDPSKVVTGYDYASKSYYSEQHSFVLRAGVYTCSQCGYSTTNPNVA